MERKKRSKGRGWESCYEVEKMMMGLVAVGTMLCLVGYVNAHVGVAETGDEDSIGRYGWGTRNREG